MSRGLYGSFDSSHQQSYSPINVPESNGTLAVSSGFADHIPIQETEVPPYATLKDVMNSAYANSVSQTPVTGFDLQCCANNPAPCAEEVAWRARFKGCPTTYSDGSIQKCEVAELGPRYWLGDLNPLLYERSLMQEAEPNPYQFMQGRQLWMQFLMSDLVGNNIKDPYTRRISDFSQGYCAKLQTQGQPAYTDF